MRSLSWVIIQYNQCPSKKGKLDTGESHVKMKGEIKGIHLEAKECQRLTATARHQGRGVERILTHSPQKKLTL